MLWGMTDFVEIVAAVLAANFLTVLFGLGFWKIRKTEKIDRTGYSAPTWAMLAAAVPLAILIIGASLIDG